MQSGTTILLTIVAVLAVELAAEMLIATWLARPVYGIMYMLALPLRLLRRRSNGAPPLQPKPVSRATAGAFVLALCAVLAVNGFPLIGWQITAGIAALALLYLVAGAFEAGRKARGSCWRPGSSMPGRNPGGRSDKMDMGCPCKEGRVGAFGLVVSFYWAMHCGGIAATLHLAAAEYAVGVWWAIWTGAGVLLLVQGIREALSHDDDVNGGSLLVSIGLIALSFWAITHHWFWLGDNWFYGGADWTAHASFVIWPGLIASETFNLWLNFRGRRHDGAPVADCPSEARPRVPARAGIRLRRRRKVTVETVEEIEGRDWQAGHEQGRNDALVELARQNRDDVFPAVGNNGQRRQIVYVPDATGKLIACVHDQSGNLIPVLLPAPGKMPVITERRR